MGSIPEPLRQVVYLSNATGPVQQDDLKDILKNAQRRNAANGITGLLLFHGGNFMQVLEGPRETVEATLARIRRDARHRGMLTILERDIEERAFGDWSMAFRGISSLEGIDPEVVSPFLDLESWQDSVGDSPDLALRLLNSFRDGLR